MTFSTFPTIDAESAGLEPGELDPLRSSDGRGRNRHIAQSNQKSAFDLFKAGRIFGYVVTVCGETSAERCPIFPGVTKRLHWSFADPASFEGSWDQRLALTRIVRDQIRDWVKAWCDEVCPRASISA
ncbi:MAG TPA: hypothetical protein VIX60_02490 [Candidatus Cybelea sp.]